jgi:isopentenyl phosphate kinase
MAKPALVKLGGSILTDKAGAPKFRRALARRAMAEIAKAQIPVVLLHGAGSFGHPAVARTGLGTGPLDTPRREAVSEVLASMADLESHVLAAAQQAGLRPVPVPIHLSARLDGGQLLGLPAAEVAELLDDGWTPVLHGSLVRDDRTGWGVLSADRILAELAAELSPRVAVFATDVDGAFDRDPADSAAKLLERVRERDALEAGAGKGPDVTGGMQGKLAWAFATARHCPTLVINGTQRGRLLDALRGKRVVGTRVEA